MPRSKETETERGTGVKLRPKSDWTSLMDIAGMHLSLAFFECLKYENIYRLPLGRVQKD